MNDFAATTHRKPWRFGRGLFLGMVYGVLIFWTAITLFGFSWVVLTSLKTNRELFSIKSVWGLPATLQWENYLRAWTRSKMGQFLFNSVLVSSAAVLLINLAGSMAAYILARFRFLGNRLILGAFILGSAIPLQLITVPLYLMFNDLGLLDSLIGLVLVYIAVSMPFTVFVLTGFFKSIPTELEEAAVLDGASEYGVFWRVMLPLATPGLITVTIFNFLGIWNEYLLALMLINETEKMTIPLGLYNLQVVQQYAADFTGLFAGFTIMLVPTVAAFIFLQERITRGMTVGAIKG
jgi:ABC-type glycerol-3-phosphate transport system permease component